MTREQQKIEHLLTLEPWRFTVLSKLTFCQILHVEDQPVSVDIELELLKDEDGGDRLRLFFTGVRDLKLQQPSWSLFQVSLKIESIAESQWENLNYKVIETDENALSFLCKDFSMTLERDSPL